MSGDFAEYQIKTETGTAQTAKALASLIDAGEIILLRGDLGAGKSFFARAFLRCLAKDETLEVPSPTFSLVQPYQFKNVECLHADLYRLSDESEAQELGLFAENAVKLIEWPDRLPELADIAHWQLEFWNVAEREHERILNLKADPQRLKQLARLLESSSDIAPT